MSAVRRSKVICALRSCRATVSRMRAVCSRKVTRWRRKSPPSTARTARSPCRSRPRTWKKRPRLFRNTRVSLDRSVRFWATSSRRSWSTRTAKGSRSAQKKPNAGVRPGPCRGGRLSEVEMTKSELIAQLSVKQPQLDYRDVELAVKELIDQLSTALAAGQRIEVRGFGSFSLHYRPPRGGRNPKTGDSVQGPDKHVPHFKPGKELRERADSRTDDGVIQ